ncbi:chorismate synthase [Flaviflexus massiliensis]|uniref:chorismate synthase n=1 Tax=Flaviflexus massiliensis TaxID=1522309 RepID=UPI001C9BE867|nr:chorismate synthase [Flaviflexus massiliensis]
MTAGESHGPALVGVVEGLPAGIEVQSSDISSALARRRLGAGRGSRQKFEKDELEILAGIRHGKTIGSPIALVIRNSEWPKWTAVMSPDPVDPSELLIDAGTGDEREISRNKKLTRPRPGHADLVGMMKYGFDEARPVLERASARETATRVALGEIAARFLSQAAGIELVSHVVRVGSVAVPEDADKPWPGDVTQLDEDPARCFDKDTSVAMQEEIKAAQKDGDTLGGVVEVLVYGMPPGLGSYISSQRRLDGRLAQALMGIQAVKGVEVGDGFTTAARRGSEAHDEIVTQDGRIVRKTNRAGGTEGGMSNGEVLRVRAAIKPISTVPRALATIDTETGEPATAIHQRSDTTAVVPGAVIAEAMVALTLAEALLEKTGGDSLAEVRRNLAGYLKSRGEHLS